MTVVVSNVPPAADPSTAVSCLAPGASTELAFCTDSTERGLSHALAVTVRAYGTQRGGLSEHIEEAIESALRAAGAGAPATWSGARDADSTAFDQDADARLSDQLYRARRIGRGGIALRLVALRALCAPVGGLDAADARTVAFYARACGERPLELEMDDADKQLPAFVVTKSLDDVIRGEAEPEPELQERPRITHASACVAEPALEETPEPMVEAASVSLATIIATMPDVEPQSEPEQTFEAAMEHADELHDETATEPETLHDEPRLDVDGSAAGGTSRTRTVDGSAAGGTSRTRTVDGSAAGGTSRTRTVDESAAGGTSRTRTVDESAAGGTSRTVDAVDGRWPEYVASLSAARGPQTLASFERLFVNSYLPLAAAIDAGLTERRAIEAREEFRRTFARAYTEALPTFVLTGKRPRMVLDAFDIAARMARAQNARTVQLLVVDGMRFDLAERVASRAAELAEGRATLADRVTLFSALPSCTPRQLESLARGIEALRSDFDDRDAEPMRGRTADTVRRMRIGSRDLYKLDLVEASLAAAGDGAIARLADVTEEAARAVAKHLRAQSGRTLVFVFGDHGFRFDSGAAKHGGASPEEVIVSGHAFAVGDLH